MTGVVDDGTGSIRMVAFGKQAEDVVGLNANEVKNLNNEGKGINAPIGKDCGLKGFGCFLD